MNSLASTSSPPNKNKRKAPTRGPASSQFPGKLHKLMLYSESQGLDHVISWIRNGTAFMVHDPEKLLEILPYCGLSQTRYRSFERQLNMWHFERILAKGPNKGGWTHPYFVRDNKLLCNYMSRDGLLDANIPVTDSQSTMSLSTGSSPEPTPIDEMIQSINDRRKNILASFMNDQSRSSINFQQPENPIPIGETPCFPSAPTLQHRDDNIPTSIYISSDPLKMNVEEQNAMANEFFSAIWDDERDASAVAYTVENQYPSYLSDAFAPTPIMEPHHPSNTTATALSPQESFQSIIMEPTELVEKKTSPSSERGDICLEPLPEEIFDRFF